MDIMIEPTHAQILPSLNWMDTLSASGEIKVTASWMGVDL